MNIKTPPCYDTSHWRTVPDFALVSPRPLLVLTKATEALSYTDPTFVKYFADLKQDSIHRGAFHFHRKAFDPTQQAKYFCDTIAPHLIPKDILAWDVEEGGEQASQLMTSLKYVEARFPNHLLMIYSRKNILDAIVMTQAQKDYFKHIPIWTAGYPLFPDLYSTPPSSYIPDQTKYGPVWLWQYTDKGQVTGVVEVNTDCNWISPVLIALLGEPPTLPDTITTPRVGTKRVSGTRHGWNFELFISDPAEVRFESVCLNPLETVSNVAYRKGATLGVNGGEWDRVSTVKDYTVTNGIVCHARVESVPSLNILEGNQVWIDHVYEPGAMQALSGLRYLVLNGIIPPYLSGTEPQYTEGHARSIHGVNSAGHHMVMQSRGVYPNQGLTLKQAAEIMKQYGAVTAFDSGGGGDVTCILDGESLIVPENVINGVHFERALPNVFLIYAKESTMNGTAREARGTNSTVRDKPSRYGVGLYPIPSNSTIDFVEKVPVVVSGAADNANDTWLKLPDGNFVNHILAGVTYYTILTNPSTEPPPASGDIHLDATLHTDGTITGTWTDV